MMTCLLGMFDISYTSCDVKIKCENLGVVFSCQYLKTLAKFESLTIRFTIKLETEIVQQNILFD